jgi:hypothetical protein
MYSASSTRMRCSYLYSLAVANPANHNGPWCWSWLCSSPIDSAIADAAPDGIGGPAIARRSNVWVSTSCARPGLSPGRSMTLRREPPEELRWTSTDCTRSSSRSRHARVSCRPRSSGGSQVEVQGMCVFVRNHYPVMRCASGMNLIRKLVSQGIAGRRITRKYSQFRPKGRARRRSKPPKWWTKWWARSRPAIAPGEMNGALLSIAPSFRSR